MAMNDVLKILGKEPLTAREINQRFGSNITQDKEFQSLIRERKIAQWRGVINGSVIYYREGFLSERKLNDKIGDYVRHMNFDGMVLGALKHSANFDDLYQFLAQYDTGKNGEPWLNEFILAQTMDHLLTSGKLEDILTDEEKVIVAASKVGPVTEDEIMSAKAYTVADDAYGEDADLVGRRIRLVNWHLLTKTADSPATYQSSYCLRLTAELERLGISIGDLLELDKISEKQLDTLKRLGLVDEKNSKIGLNALGQQQVEFMTKCCTKLESKDLLENLSAIYEHWKARADSIYNLIEANDKIMSEQPKFVDYRISDVWLQAEAKNREMARPALECLLRALAVQYKFKDELDAIKEDWRQKQARGLVGDKAHFDFAHKYFGITKEDLERRHGEHESGDYSSFTKDVAAREKYCTRLKEIAKAHGKVINEHYFGSSEANSRDLFNLIDFDLTAKCGELKNDIAVVLPYFMEKSPSKKEYGFFKNLMGKYLMHYKYQIDKKKETTKETTF